MQSPTHSATVIPRDLKRRTLSQFHSLPEYSNPITMASGNVAHLVEGPFDRRIRGVNVNMTIAGMATVTERPGASNNAELFWDELLQGAANLTDMVWSPFKTLQKNS